MCFTVTHSTLWWKTQNIYNLNAEFITLNISVKMCKLCTEGNIYCNVAHVSWDYFLSKMHNIFYSPQSCMCVLKRVVSFHSSQILTISPAMTPANQTEMPNLIRSGRAVCNWAWPRPRPSRKPGPSGPTRERLLWTGARNRKSSATSEERTHLKPQSKDMHLGLDPLPERTDIMLCV